ncbi:MAG: CRTAC1 family protein, partial [Pirellulaceae bacterium]
NFDSLMPNRLFWNRRGKHFADVSMAAGVAHLQKGHGIAFADYDHDGDQDIFIEMGGAYPGDAFLNTVFQNPGFGNHWLSVKLIGTTSNRMGVGARVRVEFTEADGTQRSIYRWMNSGGSFGANPLRLHVGLGQATSAKLEVYWPVTDRTQTWDGVPADQIIQVWEDRAQWDKMPITQSQRRNEGSL